MGRLGAAHEECRIVSGADAKDGIAVVVVLCKRCGYLMTLAADQILPEVFGQAHGRSRLTSQQEGGRPEAAARQ